MPVPESLVSLEIGGSPAEVRFAGSAPGFVGLLQVNARIPAQAATGSNVPIVLLVGSSASLSQTTPPIGDHPAGPLRRVGILFQRRQSTGDDRVLSHDVRLTVAPSVTMTTLIAKGPCRPSRSSYSTRSPSCRTLNPDPTIRS